MSSFDYVKYDALSQATQESFKAICVEMEKGINLLNAPRSNATALTKLEECYMWIGKAIRDDQIARNGSHELQEAWMNS